MVPVKEVVKAKEEASDEVTTTKEGDNEGVESGERCL